MIPPELNENNVIQDALMHAYSHWDACQLDFRNRAAVEGDPLLKESLKEIYKHYAEKSNMAYNLAYKFKEMSDISNVIERLLQTEKELSHG